MAHENAVRVAVIGGGVAGVTAALKLGGAGADVTLLEKRESLVSGPPFCHLHAGGNLYREISDAQCVALLKQSIDFARFYPCSVDYRPTVIAIPLEDPGEPADLLSRLEMLQKVYGELVAKDPENALLGAPEEYFKIYGRKTLEALKARPSPKKPRTVDEWMVPVAKHLDFSRVKFPLILVQEYGLNLFRLGAGATLRLQAMPYVRLRTRTAVARIEKEKEGWRVTYTDETGTRSERFDYLVNAAGFKTGEIDEMVGVTSPRMVEFKAAYVTKWETGETWPEIIFHGERGTPRGMGQFTPYPGGHFQLHGMTKTITLFEGGLAVAPSGYAQPRLDSRFIEKIDRGWPEDVALSRTRAAIAHLARFIPGFTAAEPTPVPLFGAQQIPGTDITRRVAEVDFPLPRYARCEIVKVSSALDMAETIVKKMWEERLLERSYHRNRAVEETAPPPETQIASLAQRFGIDRGYPADLAKRTVSSHPAGN
ncbi:FAD-dependent oxidoreductase [Hydrogenimonas cancrithermarum]|uniref:Oxidoreductase n=1 Tax=Hydrogenimonas cancrithermarum TaxID=2993563 RepID=A0ABM8FN07_9BACT|nr:FAD-dependent oxidoreductase [Hydrogenimonas cancrithermarum]BDY13687.1 oxidoreductase [Hydrogenimonas cancrithermarum]